VRSASGLGFGIVLCGAAARSRILVEGAMAGLGGWRMAACPDVLDAEKRMSRPFQPGSAVDAFNACRLWSAARNSSGCAGRPQVQGSSG
jgi:hypothetical protein